MLGEENVATVVGTRMFLCLCFGDLPDLHLVLNKFYEYATRGVSDIFFLMRAVCFSMSH
jgi:hypothetical protein